LRSRKRRIKGTTEKTQGIISKRNKIRNKIGIYSGSILRNPDINANIPSQNKIKNIEKEMESITIENIQAHLFRLKRKIPLKIKINEGIPINITIFRKFTQNNEIVYSGGFLNIIFTIISCFINLSKLKIGCFKTKPIMPMGKIIHIHQATIFVFVGRLTFSIILCKLFSVLAGVILISDL
jgi:hypothetical protein